MPANAKYGTIVEQITQALTECGPMTRADLCRHIQRERTEIASVVSRMSRAGITIPKRLHVTQYVFDQEGERRYPRAVYAIGDHPDAKPPGPQKAANKRRYDAARRAKWTANSVFNLGLPRRLQGKLIQPQGNPNEYSTTYPSS